MKINKRSREIAALVVSASVPSTVISAVGTFGLASTGTAISTLSGAAATNATLAWLGGGAIAAGGLGMTAGVVVLGGVTVGTYIGVRAVINKVNKDK